MTTLRSRASQVASKLRQSSNSGTDARTHIQLRNLPHTALPADLRRTVIRDQLKGVVDVAIDYHRFCPSGRAYLALSHPEYLDHNLSILNRSSVSTIPIQAYSSPSPDQVNLNKGMDGNGPRGGVSTSGTHVVIWGFPGKLTAEDVRKHLHGFRLAGTAGGKREVLKIDRETSGNTYSMYSKFLVRAASMAEAHRIVRSMHMTEYEIDQGSKWHIRARVIY